MKIFCSLVLAVSLLMSTPMIPQVKPVEYNLGSCGGDEFTVIHVSVQDGKLTISHLMPSAGEVVKLDQPLVFDYVEDAKKDEKGNTHFVATSKMEKDDLKINGLIREDRLIGILLVNGELGHVFYGQVGKIDDMVKDADSELAVCVVFHKVNKDQIPTLLESFLDKK